MTYTTKNIVKNGASVVVATGQTNSVVTGDANADSFYIHPAFMNCFRLDVKTAATTVGDGVTIKLQTRFSNEEAWQDSKTASVTGNGITTLSLLPNVALDQPFLPLRPQGRVVVTTGSTGATTVEAVYIQLFV
jgi:hypothetical protein